MPDPRRRSPLAHRPPIAAEDGMLTMAERAFLGKYVLRADPQTAEDKLRSALGVGVPEACRATSADEVSVLWLGPDEWMIVTDADRADDVKAKIEAAFAGSHYQLADVSDYHTTIEIAGDGAAEALMKLTPLDLDNRAFSSGDVAGSIFGNAQGVLHRRDEDDKPVFDLYVRWSMADYMWCVLAEGGREFGLPAQKPAYKVPLRA